MSCKSALLCASRGSSSANKSATSVGENASGNTIRQNYDLLEGIDQEVGKKITKLIKESKLKVQAKIQGNELRISGAKKDNLQEVISKIKELKLELPLQYINFRD